MSNGSEVTLTPQIKQCGKDPTAKRMLFVTTDVVTVIAFLFPLASEARRRGWTIGVAASGATQTRLNGVDMFDAIHDVSFNRMPLNIDNLRAYQSIRPILMQYDVIHCHTPVAAWVARWAVRSLRPRPKVIYTAHGFHIHPEATWILNRIYRILEWSVRPWTDHLTVMNRYDYDVAVNQLKYEPGKVSLIAGIGLPTNKVQASAQSAPPRSVVLPKEIPATAKIVCHIAEFTPTKRHVESIAAFASLPMDAHMILVGEGDLKQEIKNLITRLNISDRVHMLGYRDDVPAILQYSDVNVLTSEREGLPMSLMEAMAVEVPCAGSNVRGISDLLSEGRGILFSVHDHEACAEALATLLTKPTVAKECARTALQRLADYDVEKVVPQYVDLYDNLWNARQTVAAG